MKTRIRDLQHLEQVVKLLTSKSRLPGSRYLAVDVETHDYTGNSHALDFIDASVVGVGFAIKDMAWYIDFPSLIDFTAVSGELLYYSYWKGLSPILLTGTSILISHSASFDLHFIKRELINAGYNEVYSDCTNWWDTLSMAALVDENLIGTRVKLPSVDGEEKLVGALSLKALSSIYLNRPQRMWDENFMEWPVEERVAYGCDDVLNCYDLAILFAQVLHSRGMWAYYQEYVANQTYVAEHMETLGIMVDKPALLLAQADVNAQIDVQADILKDIIPSNTRYKYGLRDPWSKAAFVKYAQANQWLLPETPTGKPKVTAKVLEQLAKEYTDEFQWNDVREIQVVPVNVQSGQQLGRYLVDQCGINLPLTSSATKEKPIYSTTKDTLAAASQQAPGLEVWEPLFRMKKLQKMKTTYLDGVLKVVWDDDTVHPQWNSAGTVTGRYSCTGSKYNKYLSHPRGPALQTIPNPERLAEEEWPYNPRAFYISRPGKVFLVADLQQAEVRFLAVLSQCPTLIESIMSGEDLHTQNAIVINGQRAWDEADAEEQKKMRSAAKVMTFGVNYGMGPKSLSELLKCSTAEAKQQLARFFYRFKGVKEWIAQTGRQVLHQGYAETYLGRRRTPIIIQDSPRVTAHPKHDPDLFRQQTLRLRQWEAAYDTAIRKAKFDPDNVTTMERKSRAKRQGTNAAIQGSVGEMMNHAVWQLVSMGFNVVLQMHDELVMEVKNTPHFIKEGKNVLELLFNREIEGVPFKVEIHVGPSWASGKEK
ncbi:hypothetical protein LCGC14_1013740 [marine sediment metagenome]|uniref:DNA-directed DNA polymerase n=1 Tax=marine sediment metagenome TaxID=412755 RepID=A0A0F9QHU3_9ZZZZ